jgi:Carboxypeptidase regulatory-like domain/TonB-dependent Receptor Plug Domain
MSIPRFLRYFCSLLMLLAASSVSAFGQTDTGTLLGSVVDPTQSVVPNANVALRNTQTGATLVATTDKDGVFQFPGVLVGSYSVQVTAAGFKAYELNGISLSSAETRNLGRLRMEIGAVAEQVKVTAQATPVQTSSSEMNQTVEHAKLEELSAKGRDPFQFFDLMPGVVDTSTSRDNPTYNMLQGLNINGLSGISNVSHMLDGVHQVDSALTTMFVNPNIDAISEISVLTNGFQAEYGRNNGGSINFVTKSGTSQFHGTGHWDHRNEDLNANSFFNNRSGIARPLYRYMIAGYSIGGPVYIPKLFNRKKDRLFFFLSQEFTQIKVPTTASTANEPTLQERNGNFSDLKTSLGALIPVLDPLTETQFPGNIIPANRINPVGQGMLNLYPMPTGYVNPAPGQAYTSNSIFYGTPSHTHSDTIMKFDANITNKLTAYYRLGFDHEVLGSVFPVTPGVGYQDNLIPGISHAFHLTYTISPTLVAETLVGIGHNNYEFDYPGGYSQFYRTSSLNPPSLFPIPTQGTVPGGTFGSIPEYPPYLPELLMGGGNTVGQANYAPWNTGFFDPYANFSHDYSAQEDVTKIFRAHRFKFGFYVDRVFKDEPAPGNSYSGVYNFASSTSNPIDTGSGYSNALLGVFQTYSQATNRIQPWLHFWQIEGYAQDSWRITPRFTLEYGLRFIHQGAPNDTSGTSSDFYPSLYTSATAPVLYFPGCKVALSATGTCASTNQVAVNPLTGAQTFNALVGTVVQGSVTDGMHIGGLTGNNHYFNYPALNLAPRLGFAWDPFGNGKTAIRASAGIFYNRASLTIAGSGSPPAVFTPIVYYSYMTSLPSLGNSEVFSPTSATEYNPNQKIEQSHNFNFTIQRDIGFSTVLTLAYVGTFDRDAGQTLAINNVPYQAYANSANVFNGAEINANFLRTSFPGMGTVSYSTYGLSSVNYNSVQFTASRRASNGLFYSVAYTFSKGLGSTSPDAYHTGQPIVNVFGQSVTLPSARQFLYGPTTQDRSQVLAVNYSYLLPKTSRGFSALRAVINGWTLSGTTLAETGAPVSPGCSSTAAFPANDPTQTGQGARCQESGDPRNFTQGFYSNFNTAAFALAPVGSWGNTGLGIFRQPTWVNFDMALDKTVVVHERLRFRIRWQAYNVFNHSEFNAYGTSYSFNAANVNTSTTTGQYTSTLNPRQQELSIRAVF